MDTRNWKEDGYNHEYQSVNTNDSRVLGDDTFIDKVLSRTEGRSNQRMNLDVIMACVCRNLGIAVADLKTPGKNRKLSEARGMVAWLILETGEAKLSELSSYTGRDVSPLSSSAKAVQLRAGDDQDLADYMRVVKEYLG